MKANWKIALMCFATVAFFACKPQNAPDNQGGNGGNGGNGGEEEYVNPISVSDNSIADWDALDKDYVFEAVCPEDAAFLGLKSAKVYADEVYINILVEYDPETVTDLAWVPFHVYLNTDNSDETGGYGDQFADANTDILLEGAILADGAHKSYSPGVHAWSGEIGGTGWTWTEIAAEDASTFSQSQGIGNYFEIQMLRELIPAPSDAPWNAEEFGIGFDIQQAWNSVGILPLVSPVEGNENGNAHKMQIKIKK